MNTTTFTATTSGVGQVRAACGGFVGQATVNVLQVVGGIVQTTPPQVPFARVHLRDTVDTPLIVDARRLGGGLRGPDVIPLGDTFWWDMTSFDGEPFAIYGVFAVNVTVPADPGVSADPALSYTLVQAVLDKYAAAGFLGLVTPQTAFPTNPNV